MVFFFFFLGDFMENPGKTLITKLEARILVLLFLIASVHIFHSSICNLGAIEGI